MKCHPKFTMKHEGKPIVPIHARAFIQHHPVTSTPFMLTFQTDDMRYIQLEMTKAEALKLGDKIVASLETPNSRYAIVKVI